MTTTYRSALAALENQPDESIHDPDHGEWQDADWLDLPPSRACTVEVSELVTIAPGVSFTRTYRVIRSSHTPSTNPNVTTRRIQP